MQPLFAVNIVRRIDQVLKETGLKFFYERRNEMTSKLFIDACNTKKICVFI